MTGAGTLLNRQDLNKKKPREHRIRLHCYGFLFLTRTTLFMFYLELSHVPKVLFTPNFVYADLMYREIAV